MAKFLICAALLLVATAAEAATYTSPNKMGGEIVLTDRECSVGGRTINGLREAYSFMRDGTSIQGCWAVQDGYVHVRWQNPDGTGSTSVYRLDSFVKREAM